MSIKCEFSAVYNLLLHTNEGLSLLITTVIVWICKYGCCKTQSSLHPADMHYSGLAACKQSYSFYYLFAYRVHCMTECIDSLSKKQE